MVTYCASVSSLLQVTVIIQMVILLAVASLVAIGFRLLLMNRIVGIFTLVIRLHLFLIGTVPMDTLFVVLPRRLGITAAFSCSFVYLIVLSAN